MSNLSWEWWDVSHPVVFVKSSKYWHFLTACGWRLERSVASVIRLWIKPLFGMLASHSNLPYRWLLSFISCTLHLSFLQKPQTAILFDLSVEWLVVVLELYGPGRAVEWASSNRSSPRRARIESDPIRAMLEQSAIWSPYLLFLLSLWFPHWNTFEHRKPGLVWHEFHTGTCACEAEQFPYSIGSNISQCMWSGVVKVK